MSSILIHTSEPQMERLGDDGLDTPSRQLIWELSRLNIEKVRQDRDEVEKQAEDLQLEYYRSLAAADAHHRSVYESAKNELEAEALRQKIAVERQRQEEQEQLITLRKQEAEKLKRKEEQLLENARAAEAAERAAEEHRRQREAEELRAIQEKKQRGKEEEQRRIEAEQRAREETAAREARAKQAAQDAIRKQSQPAQPAQPTQPVQPVKSAAPIPTPPQATPRSSQQAPAQHRPGQDRREAEHQRYLQIHKNLKQFRAHMKEQVKTPQFNNVKTIMSEGRRTIQKCISQLVENNSANKQQQAEILKVLKSSLNYSHPQVDVTQFLLKEPPNVQDNNGPGLLLYFLNILAKRMIRQFIDEAAIKPSAADPVGVLVSSTFGQPELLWNGISLFDMVIAKFHVVYPVVFGIYGPEETQKGKLRLGWYKEEGAFCTVQRHTERMTGLGAGYSAIALRNFDKAKANNPFPPWHFWQSLASIINLPSQEITETHMVVLKSMIVYNEQRILDNFGDAGKAALRLAVVDFPNKAPQKIREGGAARGLLLLPEVWKRDRMLYI